MLIKLLQRQLYARHGDSDSAGHGAGRHHRDPANEQGRCCQNGESGERHSHRGAEEHGHRRGSRGHGCHHHGEHHGEHRGHGGHGRGGRGRQMKLRRLLEHGDLRFVLLALVAKKPSHGYELIKAIEEATSGLYTPSPGVIYPTLTLLEEQQYVESVNTEKGRKSYQITAEGQEQLKANQPMVDTIFQRFVGDGQRGGINLAGEIEQALHKLRGLLRDNLVRRELSAEQINRIASALNDAVERIDAELQTGESSASRED